MAFICLLHWLVVYFLAIAVYFFMTMLLKLHVSINILQQNLLSLQKSYLSNLWLLFFGACGILPLDQIFCAILSYFEFF